MPDMPGCRVEVAWETPPRTRPTDADYTRIDDNVPLRAIKTKRGFRIKTGESEASDATLTFDNRHRDLDPSNTASVWAHTGHTAATKPGNALSFMWRVPS